MPTIALTIWLAVFIVSLVILIKGADFFLDGAESIGKAFGLSPFVVGVVIVGLGTSLPELASSLAAVFSGSPEIVAANAIGSNIANVFLVVGASSLVAGTLTVTRNIVDLELPLIAIATAVFSATAYDGVITVPESILLIASFAIYLAYTLFSRDGDSAKSEKKKREKINPKDLTLLIGGAVGLVIGANYLIRSVVNIAEITQLGTGIITLAAVAVGTSLPELIVSIKAALNNKSEVALGNIFGSNAFNILAVVGIPGLWGALSLDDATLSVGLPFLIVATFLFIISGISKKIHSWEGALFLIAYVLFVGKLFGFI